MHGKRKGHRQAGRSSEPGDTNGAVDPHGEGACARGTRTTRDGEPGGARGNLYDEVTAKIIGELEAGRVPWVQPWSGSACSAPGLPRNALTQRAYSGINVLILWGEVIEHGWPSQD